MNSLEDAYINIAKEEEKLLENLKKYGMRRLTDIKKSQGPAQNRRTSLNDDNDDKNDDEDKQAEELAN
jgi:hypothetical protein